MKSKLTTALTLLLALVFVVSSFAGCANGGEGTESGSASGSDATDSGSETSEIANAKEELGKVDGGGKEFGILLFDGFSSEVKAEEALWTRRAETLRSSTMPCTRATTCWRVSAV